MVPDILSNVKECMQYKPYKSPFPKNSNIIKTSLLKSQILPLVGVFSPLILSYILWFLGDQVNDDFSHYQQLARRIFLSDTATFIEKQLSNNFSDYQQLAQQIIAGILGLLIVLTLFYLGKIHNYYKDTRKVLSENKHFNQVFDNLLQILSLAIKSVEEKNKNFSEDKILHINDHLTAMKKSKNDLDNNASSNKNSLNSLEKDNKLLTQLKTDTVYVFIIALAIFGFLFLALNVSSEKMLNFFLFLLTEVASAFFGLIFIWHQYQKAMNTAHSYYEKLLDINVSWNNDIFWLEYYIKYIQDIELCYLTINGIDNPLRNSDYVIVFPPHFL